MYNFNDNFYTLKNRILKCESWLSLIKRIAAHTLSKVLNKTIELNPKCYYPSNPLWSASLCL